MLEQLKKKIQTAKKVVVLTGAGISNESGIPTFRGKDGYWKNYKPEELATPQAFKRDPSLVWSWYDMRREICQKAEPNPAHFIVAEMEKNYPEFLLITQNVDNLHRRAGNNKLVEIHGNIFKARCTQCSWKGDFLDVPLKENPPKCPVCFKMIRPDIVWFGESYENELLERIYNFLYNCELIFVIGTSGYISVPVQLAHFAISKGAFSIDINLEHSTLSDHVDVYLEGKAGEILPELWKMAIKKE